MKVLVLDVETTVQISYEFDEETDKKRKILDNSPFNSNNRLVSVNWRKIENDTIGPNNCGIFSHNDYPISDSPESLQQALDWAELVVAHNAKYDILYLLESGFKLPDRWYCTYIGEYILSRATKQDLSLEATAIRRKVTHKKSELITEYWDKGIGFEAMPLPLVLEYADADVLSCAEIYLEQQKDWEKLENRSLNNIVTLMNDMLQFIVEIERNGINVDVGRLNEIEKEYEAELESIKRDMMDIAQDVMGDTPINLNSGMDVSKVVFSRELVNRDLHIKTFNIGVNDKGKALFRPKMTALQFANAVRTTTRKVYKTTASHCDACNGRGFVQKVKINGTNFKKITKCKVCQGRGFIYLPTTNVGGLKLIPIGPNSASANGFSCDKNDLDLLIIQAKEKNNDVAVAFLTKKKRLNAINTYLNSFVRGIKRWIRLDGLLHAGFNQCVTKTGRLSSSNPNFQNQPKGKKFPVRGAIRSRWKDGQILEADFSGLEFVVAGELSRDPQIISDIQSGKDIHGQTASIVLQKTHDDTGRPINWKSKGWSGYRNDVKPDTFAPLYGASGANKEPHIKRYYEQFFVIYKRHGEWQKEQMDNVLRQGKIRTPSGREYCFPGTRRIKGGKTTNATMIVNYPVQGFATGDIVPLACIRALRKFRELGLKSLLILTVHDSILADVFPGEKDVVCKVLAWAMTEIKDEIKSRWNYDMLLPLKCEMASGPTWMDGETVKYDKITNRWS